MTCIRKNVGDHFEHYLTISDSWDLRQQVESLEAWLGDHCAELDSACSWVADIGFNHRADALGGGPPISRQLMKLCLDANVEIYLSEYGVDE